MKHTGCLSVCVCVSPAVMCERGWVMCVREDGLCVCVGVCVCVCVSCCYVCERMGYVCVCRLLLCVREDGLCV